MTRWTLSLRSLQYYWRTQLSVLLGLTVSTAVLTGALVVGDSVRFTLDKIALDRIGHTDVVIASADRFLTEGLAAKISKDTGAPCAPVLVLNGTVATPEGEARANRVSVYGVDKRFWKLGGTPVEGVGVNHYLAKRLNLNPGDWVIVRTARPRALPGDAPLAEDDSQTIALRLKVSIIIPDDQLGRFSLQANQQAPLNIFIPLHILQDRLALVDRANRVLIGAGATPGQARQALRQQWKLEDAQLSLQPVPGQPELELRSARVFMAPPVTRAAQAISSEARPILTYLVNRIDSGEKSASYAMVTAMDRPEFEGDPNAILLNNWTAEDLDALPGATIKLHYFVMGDKRTLVEASAAFNLNTIVPIQGWAADRTLMPDFPGLSEADNCRDWDPGFELELNSIREIDEAYWDMYRGTPKAFIPLATGQRLWQNRFGHVTALRFPAEDFSLESLQSKLTSTIDPLSLGIQVIPVREQALKASAEAMNFGALFLSFSFFLIVAALLLSGLLFVFGVEQRSREIGTLLAVGFRPPTVRRLFLREGMLLSLLGSLLGIGLGTFYTRGLLLGLTSIWEGAIGNTALYYHATPTSLVTGGLAGLVMALLVISAVMRKQCRKPVQVILTGSPAPGFSDHGLKRVWIPAVLSLLLAIAAGILMLLAVRSGKGNPAAGFFSGGSLLLIAGLTGMHALLRWPQTHPAGISMRRSGLIWRGMARKRNRSLATMAVLACGSFMVVAVGANRLDALRDAQKKNSGTGGFALAATSAQALLRDLNQEKERAYYGLDSTLYARTHFVQIREKPGEDASCLNLNRAQQPRLLGIPPSEFAGRFSFAALADGFETEDPWSLLDTPLEDGALPALADNNSILWAMGKKVGDRLTYTGENGQPFEIQLVAGLANSMLQGSLLINEQMLIEKFPSLSGYQQILIDAPPADRKAVAEDLSRTLQDYGLEVEPAAQRLAAFNTVQNTYLSVFLILGGLGMILGTVGLGIVVLRNVLERRHELALLRALGFSKRKVTRLIIQEHSLLLAGGVVCGVVTALLAVLPALTSPGAAIPYRTISIIVVGILFSGFLWTALAAKLSLKGELLDALRSE